MRVFPLVSRNVIICYRMVNHTLVCVFCILVVVCRYMLLHSVKHWNGSLCTDGARWQQKNGISLNLITLMRTNVQSSTDVYHHSDNGTWCALFNSSREKKKKKNLQRLLLFFISWCFWWCPLLFYTVWEDKNIFSVCRFICIMLKKLNIFFCVFA